MLILQQPAVLFALLMLLPPLLLMEDAHHAAPPHVTPRPPTSLQAHYANVRNPELATQEKLKMNAVIGVALVLGAWIIVNFAIAALTGTPVSNVKIFGTQDWWITPGAGTTTNANADTNTTP